MVDQAAEALTRRERDVIALLERGLTTKEIAIVLSLAEQSIKFHITNIHKKLGARNRMEAVFIWRAKHHEEASSSVADALIQLAKDTRRHGREADWLKDLPLASELAETRRAEQSPDVRELLEDVVAVSRRVVDGLERLDVALQERLTYERRLQRVEDDKGTG